MGEETVEVGRVDAAVLQVEVHVGETALSGASTQQIDCRGGFVVFVAENLVIVVVFIFEAR